MNGALPTAQTNLLGTKRNIFYRYSRPKKLKIIEIQRLCAVGIATSLNFNDF